MFAKDKVSQSLIDAVNGVITEQKVDEASVKVPTSTGMKVYGGAKGGSAKAYRDQHADPFSATKGPSDKELKDVEKEKIKKEEVEELDELSKDTLKRYIPTAAADLSKKGISSGIDAQSGKPGVTKAYGDHFQKRYRGIIKATNKLANEEDTSFASRLLQSIREGKGNQPQETFTDNNMGEDKMSDAQMKKREKYVIGMKDKTSEFKAKYGKRWKDVMYATATKMAMKEETVNEAEVVTNPGSSSETTTDMLSGRVKGGKLNSFKSFKLQLKTDGEMKPPAEIEKGEDTKEKQKITTNPGPVDIKLDDKLTGPIPHTHFKDEKNITSEDVRGELKDIRSKEKSMRKKEISDFKSKVVQAKEQIEDIEETEFYEINEEKPEHTHVAHFENKDGEWMAKLLINADHDGHAIEQANEACGKGPFGNLSVRKVERVQKVMEEVDLSDFTVEEIEEFMQTEDYEQLDELSRKTLASYIDKTDNTVPPRWLLTHKNGYKMVDGVTKARHRLNGWKPTKRGLGTYKAEEVELDESPARSDIPAAVRKARGDVPLTTAEIKSRNSAAPGKTNPLRYGQRNPKPIGEQDVAEGEGAWKKETDWVPAKGDVKDKSGAVHTPLSRVKHLARTSLKKLTKETLMGTAGATYESIEILDEDKTLDMYLSSMGFNPENVPKEKKIGYANSSQYLKWKQSHS